MSVKSKPTQEDSLQGKIVILGDSQTGKSSLIRSLDPQCRRIVQKGLNSSSSFNSKTNAQDNHSTTSFTVVEVPADELEGATANVFLKFWEFKGKGIQEEQIAFPGALFCIITLDMRAPETANSAFNKWVAVKEASMPEAFLFVVGTFLDDATQRRVEIADVCKACAQKEGIYIEVSNMDGSNVLLLKRLLCQRINHMLGIREELRRSGKERDGALHGEDALSSEEAKHSHPHDSPLSSQLSPSLLSPHLLCNSVGNILSSALSVEHWQGFEAEEAHLAEVGGQISTYIQELSEGISDAPSPVLPTPDGPLHAPSSLTEPDAEEVRHLFGLMGMTLPPSLALSPPSGEYIPPRRARVKVRVRLPDDSFSHVVLQSGDDVEGVVTSFLAAHNMPLSSSAVSKLVEVGAAKLQRAEEHDDTDAVSTSGGHYIDSSSSPKKSVTRKPLKCKARIQLPDGQTITSIVSESEDAMAVAQRISQEHGLSLGYQHKIWEQLESALDQLEKTRRKTSST